MNINILYIFLFFFKNIILYILLFLILYLIMKVNSRTYKCILSVVLLIIYTLFSPIFPKLVLGLIENKTMLSLEDIKNFNPDAILILSGGLNKKAHIYNPDVSIQSLTRIRDGVLLYEFLSKNIPIIIAGGSVLDQNIESKILKNVLVEEYKVDDDIIFTEEKSKTTRENIKFIRDIMKKIKIKKLVLITSSWHLKRSVCLFKKFYPHTQVVAFSNFYIINDNSRLSLKDFIPSLETPYYWNIAITESLKYIYDCLILK